MKEQPVIGISKYSPDKAAKSRRVYHGAVQFHVGIQTRATLIIDLTESQVRMHSLHSIDCIYILRIVKEYCRRAPWMYVVR